VSGNGGTVGERAGDRVDLFFDQLERGRTSGSLRVGDVCVCAPVAIAEAMAQDRDLLTMPESGKPIARFASLGAQSRCFDAALTHDLEPGVSGMMRRRACAGRGLPDFATNNSVLASSEKICRIWALLKISQKIRRIERRPPSFSPIAFIVERALSSSDLAPPARVEMPSTS